MSAKANPAFIGSFILGIIVLTVVGILFFGDKNFFRSTMRAVMMFDGSIKGLNVGAPVTLRGVKIGEVVDIRLSVEPDTVEFSTPVYVLLDVSKFKGLGGRSREELLDELSDNGLRAQLKLQSLLTGLLYIEMDFFPDSVANYRSTDQSVPEFPTIPTDLQELSRTLQTANLGKMLREVERITAGLDDLINGPATQKMASQMSETIEAVRTLADSANRELLNTRSDLAPLIKNTDGLLMDLRTQIPEALNTMDDALAQLNEAAQALELTASNAGQQLSDDSPLVYRLNRMAKAVERSARSVEDLAETLERDPQAILRGREE